MQKECESAVFYYDDKDSNVINEVSQYLDKNVDKIWDFFEIKKPIKKVEILIYKNKSEFDMAYKQDNDLSSDYRVPNWCVGTGTKNGNISLLSLNGYQGTAHAFNQDEYNLALLKFKKRVVHEYVHFANMQFNKEHNCWYTAKFLVEGIAVLLSEQFKDYTLQLDCTKEQILSNRDCKYANYYLLTKTLIENYDKNFVLNLFQSSREANEFLEKTLFEQTSKEMQVKQNLIK